MKLKFVEKNAELGLKPIAEVYRDGGVCIDTFILAQLALNPNRGLTFGWVVENCDSEGIHVGFIQMLHNDINWRIWLLCKMKGTLIPSEHAVDLTMEEWNEIRDALKSFLEENNAIIY